MSSLVPRPPRRRERIAMAVAADALPAGQADPCSFVIFGASGDLTARLLMPALYRLALHKRLTDAFAVIGLAHGQSNDDEFRRKLKTALDQHTGERLDAPTVSWLLDRCCSIRGEFEDPAAYDRLTEALKRIEAERQIPSNRVFYLATP